MLNKNMKKSEGSNKDTEFWFLHNKKFRSVDEKMEWHDTNFWIIEFETEMEIY